jgi:hypothetical protein
MTALQKLRAEQAAAAEEEKSPDTKTTTTATATKQVSAITVAKISFLMMQYRLIGTTPFLMNQMAETAKHELWFPGYKPNKAEREARLKHDPYKEFRSALYQFDKDYPAPTRLWFPGVAFRRVMEDTTKDMKGADKTEIQRLCSVFSGEDRKSRVFIYGIPRIHIGMVRQSGRNNTPDFRTRAILEEWACEIWVRYMSPKGMS